MNDPSPPQTPLDYAPGAPIRRRKRRWRVMIGLLIALLAAGAWWKGPGVYHRAMVRYYLHEARVYSAPADQVVYDEDPARQARLLKLPHYHKLPASLNSPGYYPYVGYWAPPLERLVNANWLGAYPPALFIHERRSPAGHERLVVVWIGPNPVRANHRVMVGLTGTAIDGLKQEGTRFHDEIAPLNMENRTTPVYLRFYAGQSDPSDPSHFTIRYQIGDYSDVLDGYLEDDDRIAVFPRNFRTLDQMPQEKARRRINERNRGARREANGGGGN